MTELTTRTCGKCGATWINGQLYWATGKPGKDVDLAGLVCNKLGDDRCINPCRGQEGGDTWEARAVFDAGTQSDVNRIMGQEP